jgi:hypothetical protein
MMRDRDLKDFQQRVLGNAVTEAEHFLRHFRLGQSKQATVRLAAAIAMTRETGVVIKGVVARYIDQGGIGSIPLFTAWLRELPVDYPVYGAKSAEKKAAKRSPKRR